MSCHLFFRIGVVFFLLLAVIVPAGRTEDKPEKLWVYIGTYGGKKGKGIFHMELDMATGKLSAPTVAVEVGRPGFLAIHPSKKFMYSIGESGKKGDGAVNAYAIDAKTGKLTLLNQQSSGGEGPCFIALDKEGKNALAANFTGGSVTVVPIEEDGKLGKPTAVIKQNGKAHSINVDASSKFAFAANLGLNKVFVYKLDAAKGTLTPAEPPSVGVKGGPRHFAFHPNGKSAYVISEKSSTVTAMSYDPDKGVLKEVQTISTLPKDFSEKSSTAEILVHPSGKFLYGSNRGHDSIVIFSIDPETGKLTTVGHESTQGKFPRNFGIDPTGTYLLAANQLSDTIVVFKIDPKTGELKATGDKVEIGNPTCVRFMTPP